MWKYGIQNNFWHFLKPSEHKLYLHEKQYLFWFQMQLLQDKNQQFGRN